MRNERIKKSLCIICLGLALAMGAVAIAQNRTLTVLERVRKVEDPELGELIRVMIDNFLSKYQSGGFELEEKIKLVTQSYAQIKLLDHQIEEVARKSRLVDETGPGELRYELLLAKTELESKQLSEIAELREMMFITPKLPQVEQKD